jgi:L-lysine exporter family protein LysE/ArgO
LKPATTGFLLSLSLCLDLGLVNAAVLRTVIRQGGTAGFLLGVGSCFGDLVYFALAIFGAAVLLDWAPVRILLWLAGTIVLLYLAWKMIRESLHPKPLSADEAPEARGSAALVGMGAGLALASPSGILWFAAIGGSVIAAFSNSRAAIWQFAAGFFAAGIVWSAVFAFAIAGLARVAGRQVARIVSLASAALFIYFALAVFLRGLKSFL